MRVNIGCGQSPTDGWLNLDNSVSIRLAQHPFALAFLKRFGLISASQAKNAAFHAANPGVRYADASRLIPLPDGSVEVVYSSHMLEHFDVRQRKRFLREALRVLEPGGTIRLAVPDLRMRLERYLADGDADAFIESTDLARPAPVDLRDQLLLLVVGDRGHKWMYDGHSLSMLLESNGFESPVVLDPGETTITKPGPLDLREREEDSVYVEARRPGV